MNHFVRKLNTKSKASVFLDFLDNIHSEIKRNQDGEVASYIPELLNVNADGFGIAIATIDGYVYQVGDSQTQFSIQSISKAFTYGIALMDKGPDQVMQKVDVEPSGEAFNSISLEEETGRPKNPMINAGAIAITGLIDGASSDEKIARILKVFSDYTGHAQSIDEAIYLSEKNTGHRNRAISHMLRNYDILQDDPEESLDAYFRQCSILVSCRDLAVMGACLANNGVNPITGIRTLSEAYIPNVLSVMASCGMYDYSGNWIYNVGMPAKSGVGGGIVAVLPGQFGLAVYSPRLDVKGNSVRGISVCETLSKNLDLHMLHSSRLTTASVIRSIYSAKEIRSKRERHPEIINYLLEEGEKIQVIELMGELNFVASELIVREVENRFQGIDFLILDFSRVTGVDHSACRIFSDLLLRCLDNKFNMILVGVNDKYTFSNFIKNRLEKGQIESIGFFNDKNRALEWCEDQLIGSFVHENKLLSDLSLNRMPICEGMTEQEVNFLDSILLEKEYKQGEVICREGEPADMVYFLVTGKVDAWLNFNSNTRVWLGGSSPGDVIGESALLGNKVRSADVVADTDVVLKELVAENLLNNDDPLTSLVKEKIFRNLSISYDKKLRRATEHIRTLSR